MMQIQLVTDKILLPAFHLLAQAVRVLDHALYDLNEHARLPRCRARIMPFAGAVRKRAFATVR